MSTTPVTVPFENLPDTAVVTGMVFKSGGVCMRGEPNSPTVVLEFRRKTIGWVRDQLSDKTFSRIEIMDIRFP